MEAPPPKRRRVHKEWTHIETYPDKKSAEEAVAEEKLWAYYYENTSERGRRVSYRCKAVRFRSKQQCDAAVYLLYNSRDTTVSLFRSASDHTHDKEGVRENLAFNFTPEVKAYIEELFSYNLKPKNIKYKLAEKGYNSIPSAKVDSFLKKLRTEKYGEPLHLGTLEAWLAGSLSEPEDERDAFVVSYEIISYDESEPRFRLDDKNPNIA